MDDLTLNLIYDLTKYREEENAKEGKETRAEIGGGNGRRGRRRQRQKIEGLVNDMSYVKGTTSYDGCHC